MFGNKLFELLSRWFEDTMDVDRQGPYLHITWGQRYKKVRNVLLAISTLVALGLGLGVRPLFADPYSTAGLFVGFCLWFGWPFAVCLILDVQTRLSRSLRVDEARLTGGLRSDPYLRRRRHATDEYPQFRRTHERSSIRAVSHQVAVTAPSYVWEPADLRFDLVADAENGQRYVIASFLTEPDAAAVAAELRAHLEVPEHAALPTVEQSRESLAELHQAIIEHRKGPVIGSEAPRQQD